MGNRPTRQPTLFPDPKRGYGSPITGVISRPLSGRLKMCQIEASLAEIRGREEVLLNWRRMVRNFREILTILCSIRLLYSQPSPRALNADKNPLLMAPFRRRYPGVRCAYVEALFFAAIRARAVNWWFLFHDFRKSVGRLQSIRRRLPPFRDRANGTNP